MFSIKASLLVIAGLLAMICYLLGGDALFALGMFLIACVSMLIGARND
jgi:hypothetical protein